ncbi:hypothetical protein QFC19_001100 [Naganishia cerealis]|uniref:Uncharacterized protein n=1 Tax=Naganishia cerealis TaxID=610337 RepID=A0ACC2WK08_9TREE|nr:hypothetical protein QFC19_001100 [Naganishia cerealis]
MDPTNPLSVAPPRYKYHPSPESITRFPLYRSESDVDSADDQDREDEDQHAPVDSDECSDFSDEEDRMPDLTRKQDASYSESDVGVAWRKGIDADGVKQCGRVLIAVNQIAVVLSQAVSSLSKSHSPLQKVGHVVIRRPRASNSSSSGKRSLRKVFALWSITPQGPTPHTLLAIQVGRVSDRAVHFVSAKLVQEVISGAVGDATNKQDVKVLDSYIPQTYVDFAQSSIHSDFPPIRYLALRQSYASVEEENTHPSSRRGLAKYRSPNYVTGVGAGLLTCLAETPASGSLLLIPKPLDRQSIIQAVKARPANSLPDGTPSAADIIADVLKGADLDEESLATSSMGSAAYHKQRHSGRGRQYGIIGDGGMYV